MALSRPPTAAEERKSLADAASAEAEARKYNAEAAKAEIELEREAEKRKNELAGDEHHCVYRFTTPVGDNSVKACIDTLTRWHRTRPDCKVTIIWQSPGGEIVAGMALYDFLQELRADHHITAVARGYAASMAGILLQAADWRVMGPEAWLLIHEASFSAVGSYGEVEDRMEWIKRIQERILDIFASRSNMSKAAIKRRWHRKDWWIDSKAALQYGFVDEIG